MSKELLGSQDALSKIRQTIGVIAHRREVYSGIA
jgi:hypothetical protein